MESDQPESDATEPAPTGDAPNDTTREEAPAGPPDPAALVDRLIEAGEWPEPALIEQIAAAGEAALGPLLDFIRTYPSPIDYRREIVLFNGIGILSMIHSPATIPDLVEIIKRYPADSGEFAAEVLGDFGAVAFEPALELIRDPQVTGYRRRHAIIAAQRAAGTDPALRARLADVLRPMLADALERTREDMKEYAEEPDAEDDEDGESEGWVLEDLDDEESFDDEDEDEGDLEAEDVEEPSEESGSAADEESPDASTTGDLEPYEELMFLISDLADLADPQARDLINAAFEDDLVETFWVDKKSVDESYRKGGEPPRPRRDWLEDYRRQYREHMERLNRPPTPVRPLYQPSRAAAYSESPIEPAPMPPQETIRNTGPKLGRNDPCWCGSGKKYKKCHLGTDTRA